MQGTSQAREGRHDREIRTTVSPKHNTAALRRHFGIKDFGWTLMFPLLPLILAKVSVEARSGSKRPSRNLKLGPRRCKACSQSSPRKLRVHYAPWLSQCSQTTMLDNLGAFIFQKTVCSFHLLKLHFKMTRSPVSTSPPFPIRPSPFFHPKSPLRPLLAALAAMRGQSVQCSKRPKPRKLAKVPNKAPKDNPKVARWQGQAMRQAKGIPKR